jgi:zinc and cadmium transporter
MLMNLLLWIILATFVDGLIAFVGVFTLGLKHKSFKWLLIMFVAFSAGALLAGAFFHIIPEALASLPPMIVSFFILFGLVVFFMIERILHWHHCHDEKCDEHSIAEKPVSYLVLFGDGIHNLVDGVIIGASFLTSIPFGILTTIVIIAHEIPQELGDFAVLVHSGFKKSKALMYNFFSQLTCVIGGVLGFFFAKSIQGAIPFILSFAAGGFIYIAASDLMPELHKEPKLGRAFFSFVFFILGIAVMLAFKLIFSA